MILRICPGHRAVSACVSLPHLLTNRVELYVDAPRAIALTGVTAGARPRYTLTAALCASSSAMPRWQPGPGSGALSPPWPWSPNVMALRSHTPQCAQGRHHHCPALGHINGAMCAHGGRPWWYCHVCLDAPYQLPLIGLSAYDTGIATETWPLGFPPAHVTGCPGPAQAPASYRPCSLRPCPS